MTVNKFVKMYKKNSAPKGKGWHKESSRHSLAAKTSGPVTKNVNGMLLWKDPKGIWHPVGYSPMLTAYPRIMKNMKKACG